MISMRCRTRAWSAVKVALLGANLVLFAAPALSQHKADWPALKKQIRQQFPAVQHISTKALAEWLSRADTTKPVLLDVRTEAEYRVSHLQNAKLAGDEEMALKVLRNVERDRPIVLYCSVGYRSAALAAKLQKQRYGKVYNLEGSIFQWTNEGRPVFAGRKVVKYVHPFDRTWGRFLRRRLWFPDFTAIKQ